MQSFGGSGRGKNRWHQRSAVIIVSLFAVTLSTQISRAMPSSTKSPTTESKTGGETKGTVSSLVSQLKSSGVSASISSQYSYKAYESVANPDRDSISYTAVLGYKLSEKYSASLSASFSYDPDSLEEREQNKLSSLAVGLRRSAVSLPNGFSVIPSMNFRLPVGRDPVLRESLILSASGGARWVLPLAEWTGRESMNLFADMGAFWSVHEYEQTPSGGSNRQYGLTQALTLRQKVIDKVSVSVGASYNSSWTYQGTQQETVGHRETISWDFWDHATLRLGHSNTGPLFSYAGVNYDFSLLSERSSYFFGELEVSL